MLCGTLDSTLWSWERTQPFLIPSPAPCMDLAEGINTSVLLALLALQSPASVSLSPNLTGRDGEGSPADVTLW